MVATCSLQNMIDANTALAGTQTFDGISICITIPDNPSLNFGTGDLTIAVKVKTTQTSGVIPILDKRIETSGPVQGYGLYMIDGVLGIQLADAQNIGWTNYPSGINIADGQLHHITVTVFRSQPDGGRFYIDGREAGSRFNPTDRQGSLNNTQPLTIGQRTDNPASPELFQGEIGDLKLFNRALATGEIASLTGTPAPTTPPVGGPPDPSDLNWYISKAGLPTTQEIGEERWFSACDITAQQGAGTVNSGHVETCTYNPMPGWVMVEYKVEVLENKFGRGSYKGDLLAEGANIAINEQEIGDKWKVALDLAIKFADIDLQRKLDVEYQRHQQLIRAYNTNKNTFMLKATANGGLFRKSVIHVKGLVRCVRL